MKKTLVALAAMAVVGAASAQVTITGKMGFSYQANSTADGKTKGMRMTDGDVVVTAVEDLGGGWKASASTAVKLRGRDTNVGTRDGSVQLMAPGFTVSGAAMEAGPMIADAWSGPWSFADGIDTKVLDGYANIDMIGVAAPVGPVTLSAGYFEVGQGNEGFFTGTAAAPVAPLSTAGNATGTNGYLLKAVYAAGPIMAAADFTVYSSTAAAYVDGLNRMRLVGTYDLGVVKLGAGFQSKSRDTAAQYTLGVSAPFGATTVSMGFASRAAQGASTLAGAPAAADSRTGTQIAAEYAFSKTTTAYAGYATYTGITGTDNEYRIRLMKKF